MSNENDSSARHLVLRELTAIVALRFRAPELYGAMVELGRTYTEPETLVVDSGVAVDEMSSAGRLRNVRRYLQSALFGWCPRCFGPVVTYPDGRRLDWPTLDHHEECTDPGDVLGGKARTRGLEL